MIVGYSWTPIRDNDGVWRERWITSLKAWSISHRKIDAVNLETKTEIDLAISKILKWISVFNVDFKIMLEDK